MKLYEFDLERFGAPAGSRGLAFPHIYFMGGGGGGAPSTPIITAPPPPAATQTTTEVTQAKLDAKRQAKARTGINSTILAGNDLAGNAQGKNTLLGGG